MSDRPAVIIPTFNGAELLERALASLAAQTIPHSVVVVDNGSTDATAEVVGKFEETRLLRLPENQGFARAVNAGVRSCAERTIVVLNNDVACEPPFLEQLCAALDPSAGVVMAAGVLLEWTDPSRIDSAGIIFDRTLFALDYLHGEPASVLDDGPPDPLGPTGGAAAFDRDAFDAVGGFDERFFAYLEDVDLVARLMTQGGRCRLAGDARACHRHSATAQTGTARKNRLMGWGRGYTIAKYRLHRRPSRFARAVAAELVISGGQAVIDRTVSGTLARVSGFRAGLAAPEHEVPRIPESIEPSLLDALRRRARRRARA